MTTPPNSNFIHPTAVVGPDVVMGEGNYIGPYCVVYGKTVLGHRNRLEAHCAIGTPPEHTQFFTHTEGAVQFGDDNVVREFVTVNAGMAHPTVLGDRNSLLRGSYLGHDSIVENDVILAPNALVGGHSYLMSGCYFGLASMCHQYSVIGAYVMLGMGAVVPKHKEILPCQIFVGNPVTYLKENEVGIQRWQLSPAAIAALRVRYHELVVKGRPA